jgi:N-acetylmuramoyl-L-alanine amidase
LGSPRKPKIPGLTPRLFRACYPHRRISRRTHSRFRDRRAALLTAAFALLLALPAAVRAEERATILWKGETFPIGTLGGKEFVVSDAARALGLSVSSDKATGVLTITSVGHQVLLGPGTAQVPVDRRIVPISGPARLVGGALYAPPDFFEKVLFPLGGAAGTWDAAKKTWTLVPAGPPPLSIEIAVVHVAPTTQVVFRLSSAAKTATATSERSFQVRFADTKLDPPFPEKRYEDPLVASVRFTGELATIDFREPGLSARAYPLSSPDRLVVEVGRRAALPPAPVPAGTPGSGSGAAPAPQDSAPLAPGSGGAPLTIVVDPGHGGGETGAVGPGGYQEKEATLAIAQRLVATLPRTLACRAVLTRDSDIQLSLDDRTSIANHEKADLFLSIHANSSRSASAQGSETYYLSLEASDKIAQEVASRENAVNGDGGGSGPAAATGNPDLDFVLWDLAQSAHLKESSEIAEAIQVELNAVSDTASRGIKQAPFRVLVGATMPAVLVEVAFISNADEEKRLRTPEFQQAVADAVARAVARFYSRRLPAAVRPTPSAQASP